MGDSKFVFMFRGFNSAHLRGSNRHPRFELKIRLSILEHLVQDNDIDGKFNIPIPFVGIQPSYR